MSQAQESLSDNFRYDLNGSSVSISNAWCLQMSYWSCCPVRMFLDPLAEKLSEIASQFTDQSSQTADILEIQVDKYGDVYIGQDDSKHQIGKLTLYSGDLTNEQIIFQPKVPTTETPVLVYLNS